jgi:hypothetical protein
MPGANGRQPMMPWNRPGHRHRPLGGDAAGGAGVFFYTSMALADPARLRNSNFWILPVLVLGSSPKTT